MSKGYNIWNPPPLEERTKLSIDSELENMTEQDLQELGKETSRILEEAKKNCTHEEVVRFGPTIRGIGLSASRFDTYVCRGCGSEYDAVKFEGNSQLSKIYHNS